MRIADLLLIRQVPRAVALSELGALRDRLDAEGPTRALETAAILRDLLAQYVAEPGDEAEAALGALIGQVTEARGTGAGMLVQGPVGAGKSHLLLVLALLLEYPEVWPDFLSSHPAAEAWRAALTGQRRRLVVPVPLAEHRGHNEHLEDIFFERTEQELARPKYGGHAPLSSSSYALALIERHLTPRYQEELDTRARQQRADCANWAQLCAQDRKAAIALAQYLANELGYPLDFTQSRVERVSRLLEVLRDADLGGVIWLVDDLSSFLASVDSKAVRGDIGFLEFLGQRARISPFFAVAAVEQGAEELAAGTGHLVQQLRATYDLVLTLGAAQVREVAFQRVVQRVDPERYAQGITEIYADWRKAFGQPSFGQAELAESYPLHPLAARCLQSISTRLLDKADGLLEFLSDTTRGVGAMLEREARQLITPAEVLEYLRPQLANQPQAAPYLNQALDYYLQNAEQLIPEDPEGAVEVARTLVALRLGNIAATADLVAELSGLRTDGAPRLGVEQARRMLENLRLTTSYVDVRRGTDPDSAVYLIDVQTSLSELVRQRLNTVKATLAEDDDRLWQRVLASCDSPTFPLGELAGSQEVEITWQNSSRWIAVELVNFATLTPAQLGGYAAELADPTAREVCRLFIARLLGAEHQLGYWKQLGQSLPAGRWRAGLLAWIPRPITPGELDVLRQCAACHELLRQRGPEGEVQAAWRGRLLEERMVLDNEVRQIVHAAYYSGQVLSADQVVLQGEDLLQYKSDWLPTLATIAAAALEELFPGFRRVASRRPLDSRETLDALIEGLIRPRSAEHDPDAPLTELAQSFLGPLGLIQIDQGRLWLDAGQSQPAREVLDRIRQRDQTPQQEQGRPLSCADLAQHTVKATLGLPPEMFELLIASLVRLGHLVALDADQQPMLFDDIPAPFAANVAYVARPALLATSQWQVLSRLARIVLETGIPGPEAAVQHYVWERLLEVRGEQLARLEQLERRLEQLQATLGQEPRQWPTVTADLDDARDFYRLFDASQHSSAGLRSVIDKLEPYMREGQGATLLSALLRRINLLDAFLDKIAPDVITMHRYLGSPDLVLPPGGDLDMRRRQILEMLAAGEELVGDEPNLRRQLQIFLSGYKRHYLNWHARCHHATAFERYRSARATPEFRALQQLQGLDIEVRHQAARVGEMLEQFLSRRCLRQDLSLVLDEQPICPACRLRLEETLELPPVEEMYQMIEAGLAEYGRALQEPGFAEKLRRYSEALPHHGDLRARLLGVLEMPTPPTAREVLTYLTDEVIANINRVIAGKTLIPRNLAELEQSLGGRTITKHDAQRLLQRWLDGLGDEVDDDEVLLIE